MNNKLQSLRRRCRHQPCECRRLGRCYERMPSAASRGPPCHESASPFDIVEFECEASLRTGHNVLCQRYRPSSVSLAADPDTAALSADDTVDTFANNEPLSPPPHEERQVGLGDIARYQYDVEYRCAFDDIVSSPDCHTFEVALSVARALLII